MKNTLETRLGIFVALIAIAAVLIIETVGGLDFRPGHRLYALFDNVQELKIGDRVKMAGVEIGRVEAIDLETNKVRVTMKLKADAEVRDDSVATVKFTGLMGQNFVAISFGTPNGTLLADGQYLTTAEQPDLSTIMTKLDNVASGVENLTKSFTGDKIDNILGPFTDFLRQNTGPLTATIANMRAVSGQIAEGKGTVGRLIYDETLYQSAMQAVTNLQLTIADARNVIADVNSGQGTVGRLMHDPTLYNETTASMTNLKEILQKINQGQGTVGKVVNDQDFYKNAKLTLQKLDKMTDSLEDQGPLSVVGTVVGNLF